MERSGSQKFLKFVSIIAIIFGSIGVFFGLLLAFGGGAVGSSTETLVEGMTNQQAAFGVIGVGLAAVVSSGFELASGILGVRASNDAQKIMPVWVFSLIGFILAILGLVANIMNGSMAGNTATSVVASLIGSGLMLWIANNIKIQAGR